MVDIYILDLLVIGLLLLMVTLGSSWISRLPFSFALIYLIVGIVLGPYGFRLIQVQPNAEFLQRLTEFVVIVSVFNCGLKMNRPLQLWAWKITARLIGFLMPISIFAVAAVGHWALGMDWGGAILLGAILAPTDPVLASEVQLADLKDEDELRFGLTSEGGLNDALAFPFVYFGLHWIKDPNVDNWFKQWVAVDLIWAIAAAIVMGIIAAKVISWVEQKAKKRLAANELMDDFVALGTILITYSLTEIVNGYGFLAVFVAGIIVKRNYEDPETQYSRMEFTERIEKLMEVGTILLVGSILRVQPMLNHAGEALLIAGSLIFLIRPVGAWLSTIGADSALAPGHPELHPTTRKLFGWFGIRGVGSLYYLSYAFGEGLRDQLGEQIAWITYTTIAISVVLHGISATPLMNLYEHEVVKNNKKDSILTQPEQSERI